MISICAVCKKELKRESRTAVGQPLASSVLHGELTVSHGLCYECGVTLYGAEMMTTEGARMNRKAETAAVERRDRRNHQT